MKREYRTLLNKVMTVGTDAAEKVAREVVGGIGEIIAKKVDKTTKNIKDILQDEDKFEEMLRKVKKPFSK
jgi:hypothetical protein